MRIIYKCMLIHLKPKLAQTCLSCYSYVEYAYQALIYCYVLVTNLCFELVRIIFKKSQQGCFRRF